eukprot:897594-Rhodomonas_salina.1
MISHSTFSCTCNRVQACCQPLFGVEGSRFLSQEGSGEERVPSSGCTLLPQVAGTKCYYPRGGRPPGRTTAPERNH